MDGRHFVAELVRCGMLDRIAIVGHPSRVGGADTELDHQIRCWLAMGVAVHICPTSEVDDAGWAMGLRELGCIYHTPCDWPSLEGLPCISFCNSVFLDNLDTIKRYARLTTFVNCMSWNFEKEVECQERGLIDFHLYQTGHSFDKVSQRLKDRGCYRPLFFTPYFDVAEYPYIDDRLQDKFRFGRISRPDPAKYAASQLWIYETMTAPVLKEGLILGWAPQVEAKFGKRPDSFVQALPANSLSQRAFYTQCEALIMTTDTFENLPRVGFEAMAAGTLVIVDDRGGWRTQVEDGVSGWLCKNEREFVYKASRCAFEVEERCNMRRAARTRLETQWGLQAASDSWAQVFDAWEAADCQRSPGGRTGLAVAS
jgi:hypothetical protein